jgi:hypothetical protein
VQLRTFLHTVWCCAPRPMRQLRTMRRSVTSLSHFHHSTLQNSTNKFHNTYNNKLGALHSLLAHCVVPRASSMRQLRRDVHISNCTLPFSPHQLNKIAPINPTAYSKRYGAAQNLLAHCVVLRASFIVSIAHDEAKCHFTFPFSSQQPSKTAPIMHIHTKNISETLRQQCHALCGAARLIHCA